MKKFSLKLAVGLLALVIGIVIVWTSGIIQVLFPQPAQSSLPSNANETALTSPPTKEESGKIVLHFKGFEPSKDWIANFEIVNYTAQPIIYIGHKRKDKFGFCTLAAKRDEIYEPTGVETERSGNATLSHCFYSKAVILQTIEPGKSVRFSVFKYEVRNVLHLKAEHLKTNAQIGFEFFVGDEKRREMLWSEEITFPDDEI